MISKDIRRYTDLPSVLYMLRNKKLTLLDPSSWDDKNDSYFLEVYKKRKKLSSVYALCFTEKNETYHHWSVFCSRENGVCVVFDRDKLIGHLNQQAGITCGPVNYRTIGDTGWPDLEIDDLPFLKRWAFRDESEFRAVYSGDAESEETKDISLPLSCIKKISVNPWVPDQLFSAIKETIKEIEGCRSLAIGKSQLINNKSWKRYGNIIA
jgi:hypothetical protein